MADPSDSTAEPEDETDEESLLDQAKKLFNFCVDREAENRTNYIDDVKFGRLGGRHQWPDLVYEQRTAQGLPCLTINRMPSFVRQVTNDTRQNKPAITVKPVDSGADRHTAEILSGLIRNIEYTSNADAAYDTAVDCSASGGFGYMRVVVDWAHDDSFDKDIKIERVADPLTIYGDPYSFAVDSSDWNDAFIVDSIPVEEFKKRYPKAEKIDFKGVDKLDSPWMVGDNVLVAEWWHREEVEREIVKLSNGWTIDADEYDEDPSLFAAQGAVEVNRRTSKSYKVTQRIMNGAEILETDDEYPGKYIPVIPVYGEEVVIEGKRILRSLIRDGKDPQKNFNFWRSKASESAGNAPRAPWLGHESAFTGDYSDRWDTANTQNWPWLAVPDGVDFPQRQGFVGPDPAALQEAASSSDDMKSTIGIFDAALGAQSNETSGRAINARKVESDTGTFHFADNLSRAIRILGIIIVDLAPHIYTPGRIVRVLGLDGSENQVMLGTKKPQPPQPGPAMPGIGPIVPDQPMPAIGSAGQPPMQGGAAAMPPAPIMATPPGIPLQTPQIPPQPTGEPDYGAIYDIALGKYDVVVSAGPGYATRRQEAADQMMQLIQSVPQVGPLIGDLIAENLDWPGADKIAKRLQAMLPPQIQALMNGDKGQSIPPQLMQQIAQGKQLIQNLMQALQQCKQELSQAKGDNTADIMDAQAKQLGAAVDKFNAETDRMQAETERIATVGTHPVVAAVLGQGQPSALPAVPTAPAMPGPFAPSQPALPQQQPEIPGPMAGA